MAPERRGVDVDHDPLVLTCATADLDSSMNRAEEVHRAEGTPLQLRPRSEVAEFCTGLELREPGPMPICDRRPESDETPAPAYGGVARKAA